MNYREMRYVIPPELLKAKIITPGEVYTEKILKDIPNIIGDNIWEIIDFRDPRDGESWITVWGDCMSRSGGIPEDYPNHEQPRFIIQRKITNEAHLVWLLKRHNSNMRFYRGLLHVDVTTEGIDREIRKERT